MRRWPGHAWASPAWLRAWASTWCAYSWSIEAGTASAPCCAPARAWTELTVIVPDVWLYDEPSGRAGSHRTSAFGAAWPNSEPRRACPAAIASPTHMARRNLWPSGTVTLNPRTASERFPTVVPCSSYVRLPASATLYRGPSAANTIRRSTSERGSVGSSVSTLMSKKPVPSVAVQAPRGSAGSARLSRSVSVRLSSPTSYMQTEAPGWTPRVPLEARE